MDIVFRAVAYGAALVTVEIPANACIGISVMEGDTRIALQGGLDTINQIITILDLPWPHQK